MSRALPEWIGKNDDVAAPPRVRLRVFIKFGRSCAGCGVSLIGRRWTCDHIKALINGGENRETNLQPLGDDCCNKQKNAADVAEKAATYQTQLRHHGVRRKPKGRPIPGTVASGIKKPFNGPPIDRNTGRPIGRQRT